MKPNWRKPVGMAAILALVAILAIIVGSFSNEIAQFPKIAQGLFYLFCGTIWIAPLGPLLSWMETGHFRKPQD
jgi:hypothetical protein